MVDLKELFHSVTLKRKLYFAELLEETELNLMEIEVLVFLKCSPENNTFTEIMKSKDYAKSYISKAITNLVEKGYLSKQASPDNKKVYRLYLLDKSQDIVKKYDTCVEQFRMYAFAGISEEELQVFENVMIQISNNIAED